MTSSLRLTLINCAACAVSIGAAYYKVLPQPWDIVPIGVASILCPILGFWVGVSVAAREIKGGRKKTQSIIAITLSIGVFVYGFLVLTTHR